MSMTAAIGMPKFDAGPQKSVICEYRQRQSYSWISFLEQEWGIGAER